MTAEGVPTSGEEVAAVILLVGLVVFVLVAYRKGPPGA